MQHSKLYTENWQRVFSNLLEIQSKQFIIKSKDLHKTTTLQQDTATEPFATYIQRLATGSFVTY